MIVELATARPPLPFPRPPSDLPVQTVELDGARGLDEAVGRWLGRSTWLTIGGEAATSFDAATRAGSRSWVSDFQTLACAGAMLPTTCRVRGRRHAVNYGIDDVTFHRHLTVGGRIRIAVMLLAAAARGDSVDVRWHVVAEGDDGPPLLAATMIARYAF